MRVFGTWGKRIGALACAACVAAGGAAASVSSPGAAPSGLYRLDPVRSGVTLDVAYFLHARLTMRVGRM
ncbi:MAG: YceI family protein, partial [Trinickia sp.]